MARGYFQTDSNEDKNYIVNGIQKRTMKQG